jgi:hypothetical protein
MRRGSGGMCPLDFNLSPRCLCLSVSGTVDFFFFSVILRALSPLPQLSRLAVPQGAVCDRPECLKLE